MQDDLKKVEEFRANVLNNTWILLKDTIKIIQQKDKYVYLKEDAEKEYREIYMKMEEYIKTNYMKPSVEYLDRHKTSAIIIYAILKSQCIQYSREIKEDEFFFGEYLIALSVGFNYMLDRLNAVLKKKDKRKRQISKIWLPDIVFSCDVPYFTIFARSIYFADKNEDWGINVLEIAEKLFLLEYVTIERKKINPKILKEEHNEKENSHENLLVSDESRLNKIE